MKKTKKIGIVFLIALLLFMLIIEKSANMLFR
jgi:hypothetical protein